MSPKQAGVARVTVSRVLNNVAERPAGNARTSAARGRERSAIRSITRRARWPAVSGAQIMLIHAHNPEREPNSYYNAGLELGALARVFVAGL